MKSTGSLSRKLLYFLVESYCQLASKVCSTQQAQDFLQATYYEIAHNIQITLFRGTSRHMSPTRQLPVIVESSAFQ